MNKTCRHCGKEFEAIGCNATRQQFCCSGCKIATYRVEKATGLKTINKSCVQCHSVFADHSPNSTARYCSKQCKLVSNTIRRNNAPVICAQCGSEFLCPQCGASFKRSTVHSRQKFCSTYCSHKFHSLQYVSSGRAAIDKKERYHDDLNFKITCSLRSRLNQAIKNGQKAGSAVRDLGCTISELKSHLESKFLPGMTWENYGKYGWHIDHIEPLSKFNLCTREEFKKACHFTNLQPLWAEDNLKKSNKLV